MFRYLSLLAIGWAALSLPVSAQDSVLWKNVGDWEVSIDPTIGNGCYAVASWNGGTVLRIGLNPQDDNFYVLIGNDSWTSLKPEESYDLQIQFDRRNAWDVSANGLQFNPGETVYLHATSSKFDFIREFMRGSKMKISYNGKKIDTLKLRGSSRAFKEVMNCQNQVDARDASSGDPFKPGSGKKGATADPFAN